jgi:ABC-type dipeptide/oligopeptide/nickel transport system ATPase subunit
MPDPLCLSVSGLSCQYLRNTQPVTALSAVHLELACGSCTGLAGGSGSGKSTLARCLAGWQLPSAGLIRRHGEVQLVMQDPGASLNPRFTAEQIVGEPLAIRHRAAPPSTVVASALARVGLPASRLGDRATAFSGGERARLALARALIAIQQPSSALLILDESLSSLDDRTSASILALLTALRRETGLALLIVSHELALLSACAEHLLVLYEGSIVECGPPHAVISNPRHPHTARLVQAMPREQYAGEQ